MEHSQIKKGGNRNLSNEVSVVIVTFNHHPYIGKCLESVIQNHPFEVIVVDNGSSDKTLSLIENEFPDVRIIRNQENYGYGKAVNIGVWESSGNYVIVLNPDTIVENCWLDSLVNPLIDRARIITVPKILTYDGEAINTCGNIEHFTGLTFTRGLGDDPESFSVPEVISGLSGACFAMRREDYLGLKGFDETFFLYMEDAEFSWRANMYGFEIVYAPESVVWHDYSLEVAPEKLYFLEKGRYQLLQKYLTRRDLASILPSLLITEMLTWGYAFRLGTRGLKAKARSMRRSISINTPKNGMNLKEIIDRLEWRIPIEQLSSTKLDDIAKAAANVMYHANRKVLIR